MGNSFMIALRGYDVSDVDRLLDRAHAALASSDPGLRRSAAEALRSADFRQRLRGYDRAAVDRAVEDLLRELT